jgi:tRNA dimethylallyltransferase
MTTLGLDPADLRRCWFLAGPTASGKSAVALELAERLSAEIVALDSMTLYRGMDLGTAKPTAEERARVPHHLFDLLEPHEEFSVAAYLAAARTVTGEILARGRVPLFVGGTGLYLRSLLRGVLEGPPADTALRAELARLQDEHGAAALHARLQTVDPVAAARLPPQDVRRVTRALEVVLLTGEPLSARQTQGPSPEADRPRHVYWLDPPRPWLHARINQRVEAMFAAGLVEEVGRLVAREKPMSHTARQALGYKELLDVGPRPSNDWRDVITLIQTRTRQFAKRQTTWFRNLVECRPVTITGEESPAELAERLFPPPRP